MMEFFFLFSFFLTLLHTGLPLVSLVVVGVYGRTTRFSRPFCWVSPCTITMDDTEIPMTCSGVGSFRRNSRVLCEIGNIFITWNSRHSVLENECKLFTPGTSPPRSPRVRTASCRAGSGVVPAAMRVTIGYMPRVGMLEIHLMLCRG